MAEVKAKIELGTRLSLGTFIVWQIQIKIRWEWDVLTCNSGVPNTLSQSHCGGSRKRLNTVDMGFPKSEDT